jgi:hypothetical protein
MTKYLNAGPFSEGVGGKSTENEWEMVFGARVKMRCPNKCRPVFCKRKDRVAWQMGGDPEEWVCKRCGAPAEHVSRVQEAIELGNEIQAMMDQVEFE